MTDQEKNTEQLKDFFQSTFTDRSEEVPLMNWEKVSAGLDVLRNERKSRKRRFIFWLSGFLILVGTVGTILVMNAEDISVREDLSSDHASTNEGEEKSEISETAGAIENVNNSELSSGNNAGAVSDQSAVTDIVDTRDVTSENDRKIENNSTVIDQKSQDGSLTEKKSSDNTNKATDTGSGGQSAGFQRNADVSNDNLSTGVKKPDHLNETSADVAKIAGDDKVNGEYSQSGGIAPEVVSGNEPNDSEAATKEETLSNEGAELNSEIASPRTEFISPLPFTPLTAIPFFAVYSPVFPTPILQKVSKIPRWEISLYAGYGRRGRSLSGGAGVDDVSSHVFNSLKPQRQFYRNAGIRFGYSLNDRLTLNFGIQTGYWRFRSREYQKLIVQSAGEYTADAPVGKMSADVAELQPFYDANPTMDTLLFKIRMWQNLRYVSLPVSLQIALNKGPVKPYLRCGMTLNYLAWQRTAIHFTNSGIQHEINFGQVQGLRKVHLGILAGFGVKFDLSKRFALFAEGQVETPLSAFYKPFSSTYQKIRSRGVGLSLGMTFKL